MILLFEKLADLIFAISPLFFLKSLSSIIVSSASANFSTFRFSTKIPQSLFSIISAGQLGPVSHTMEKVCGMVRPFTCTRIINNDNEQKYNNLYLQGFRYNTYGDWSRRLPWWITVFPIRISHACILHNGRLLFFNKVP